eukprot:1160680-Pelagomonas_calceolata.AAC.7
MGHVLDNFWQWSENCHLKPSGPRGLAGILQCRKGGLLTLLSYLVLSSIQDDCVPTSNCKENVLLTSEEQTPGGQVAKLADFGEWYNLKAVALMCTCFCAKGPSVVTQRDILLAFTYLSSVQTFPCLHLRVFDAGLVAFVRKKARKNFPAAGPASTQDTSQQKSILSVLQARSKGKVGMLFQPAKRFAGGVLSCLGSVCLQFRFLLEENPVLLISRQDPITVCLPQTLVLMKGRVHAWNVAVTHALKVRHYTSNL